MWHFILLLSSVPSTFLLLFTYAAYNIFHDYVQDRMSAFFTTLIRQLIATAEKLKQSARLYTDPQGRVHVSYQYYAAVILSLVCKDVCKACNKLFFNIIMFKIGAIICIFNHPTVIASYNRLCGAFKAKSSTRILLSFARDYLNSVSVEIGKHLCASVTGIVSANIEFAGFLLANVFILWRKIKKEVQEERSAFLNWWEDFVSKMNIKACCHLLTNTTLASDHDDSIDVSTKNKSEDYLFRVRVITDTTHVNTTATFHSAGAGIQLGEDETASESSSSDNLDIDAIRLPPPPPVIYM